MVDRSRTPSNSITNRRETSVGLTIWIRTISLFAKHAFTSVTSGEQTGGVAVLQSIWTVSDKVEESSRTTSTEHLPSGRPAIASLFEPSNGIRSVTRCMSFYSQARVYGISTIASQVVEITSRSPRVSPSSPPSQMSIPPCPSRVSSPD